MIKGILQVLLTFVQGIVFVLCVSAGMLLAAYIIAGVAFRGDWDRVNQAVERAYDEFFE